MGSEVVFQLVLPIFSPHRLFACIQTKSTHIIGQYSLDYNRLQTETKIPFSPFLYQQILYSNAEICLKRLVFMFHRKFDVSCSLY